MHASQPNITRQVRFLQVYSLALTLIVALMAWHVFFRPVTHVRELNAERINILEKDGTLRLVISNRERQHPGIVDGKTLPPRDRGAGFMFFNDEGDECGGFVYSGEKGASDMGFSLDQYANDQILQLQYGDEVRDGAHKRHYGLKMWDRNDEMTTGRLMKIIDSLKALNDTALINTTIARMRAEGLIGPERLFVGKTDNRSVGLFLRDDRGRPRLTIGLDSLNNVIFNTYDSAGNAVPLRAGG
ncbi:hypothetical protein [Chitinophaga deserti]|uniref:hypothetical protein n=1 Tax=Chitinophaga deserti TaxID=2164099 RepID=UPI000D6C889F|nr:hypothetical protein [Chitinophaga deserti]